MAGSSTDIYINYATFESWASKLDGLNKELRQELEQIQKKVNSLNGQAFESNSAVTIREKITGMTPRFDQYKDVCDNYITFIKRTAEEWKTTDAARNQNANQFI